MTVGRMSLDMVFMLLADKGNLRRGSRNRTRLVGFVAPDKDGFVAGRDVDGNPMKATIGGESLAARLTREAAEKEKAKKEQESQGRRGRRRLK